MLDAEILDALMAIFLICRLLIYGKELKSKCILHKFLNSLISEILND